MQTPNSIFSEASRISAIKEQVSSDLGEEVVMLNLKSGIYFGLNSVGASIWNQIQELRTVAEIRLALLEEYEVEPDVCDRDLQAILQEMLTAGLIEVEA